MASAETLPFVAAGRQAQFERLQGVLGQALAGQPQVVFVAGDAGTGKTMLVREFCRRAEDADEDLIVAWGQCSAQHGDPYLPFREIVALLTGDVDGALAGRTVDDANARRLKSVAATTAEIIVEVGADLVGILVPGAALLSRVVTLVAKAVNIAWVKRLKRQVEEPPSQEGFKPEQLFEQFSRVMTQLAEKTPLVLVLDDLHWADNGTLEMFFYLTRRLQRGDPLPFMLLGTYRTAEVMLGRDGSRHPLQGIVNEVRRYWGDVVLDLGETIGGQAGRDFVDALIDSEPNWLGADFRELLFRRTDGHPLYTVEILRTLEERGVLAKDPEGRWIVARPITLDDLPDRVEAVIEERIDRLERGLKAILTCGSVEGEQFTAEIVARVRRVEELQLAEQLSEELERRHLLIAAAGETQTPQKRLHMYRFLHALFQQFLYDNLSSMQRQQLHRAVGEALEALYDQDAGEVAVQLARHFDEAFEDERAIKYLLMAGDQARATYANADAVRHYTRAREIIARGQADRREQEYQIARSLAQVYALQGRGADQRAETEGMLRLAHLLADKTRLADAYTVQARFFTQMGEYVQAKQAGMKALGLAEESADEARRADAHVAVGEACSFLAEHGEALTSFQAGLEVYRELGDRQGQAEVSRLVALVHLNRNDYPEALEHAQNALVLFREIGHRSGEDETLRYIGDIHCGQGDYQQGLDYYQQALDLRRRIGNRAREGGALGDIGDVYLFVGRYKESLDLHRQSLEIDEQVGYKYGQTWCHHDIGLIQFNLGNLAAAKEDLERALALAVEIQAQNLIVLCKNDLSLVLRAMGGRENLAKALQLAREAAETGKDSLLVFGHIAGLSYQAMAYLALGNMAEAERHSEAAVELLEAHGATEVVEEEILFNHYLALRGAGKADEVGHYLQRAHDEVMAKANRIQDPAMRESFLTRVPLNREILAAQALVSKI